MGSAQEPTIRSAGAGGAGGSAAAGDDSLLHPGAGRRRQDVQGRGHSYDTVRGASAGRAIGQQSNRRRNRQQNHADPAEQTGATRRNHSGQISGGVRSSGGGGGRAAPRPITTKEKLCYTVPEAASLLGLSRNFGYELARRGEIPTRRFGNRIVVPKAEFDKLLGCHIDSEV